MGLRALRAIQYLRHEVLVAGFIRAPRLLKLGEYVALRYLKRKVSDESLRQKLTPTFRMGCKRILLSNDYFKALQKPQTFLETTPISRITPKGILLTDGQEIELDVLVFATGFQAAEPLPPFEIKGRDGISITEAWRFGAQAYRGTTLHGFPNLFMIVGPNTGLGHSSMLLMIEAQARYISDALRRFLPRRRFVRR